MFSQMSVGLATARGHPGSCPTGSCLREGVRWVHPPTPPLPVKSGLEGSGRVTWLGYPFPPPKGKVWYSMIGTEGRGRDGNAGLSC